MWLSWWEIDQNQNWYQREIENLFENVWDDDGSQYVPVRLKLGADRESVIDYAVAQIGYIAKKLEEAMEKAASRLQFR